MTALREKVDWLSLPPKVRNTIQTLGPMILADYSQTQMAKSLGVEEHWVTERISELREALLSQAAELEDQLRERAEMLRRTRGGIGRRQPAPPRSPG